MLALFLEVVATSRARPSFTKSVDGAKLRHAPFAEIESRQRGDVSAHPNCNDRQTYKHRTTPSFWSVWGISYQRLPAKTIAAEIAPGVSKTLLSKEAHQFAHTLRLYWRGLVAYAERVAPNLFCTSEETKNTLHESEHTASRLTFCFRNVFRPGFDLPLLTSGIDQSALLAIAEQNRR